MSTQNLGIQEAISRVLRDATEPLRADEIAHLIVENRYRPEANLKSVAANLTMMVQAGTVVRPERARYALNPQPGSPVEPEAVRGSEEEARLISVSAYGLYWERDKVNWEPTNGKLLGSPDNSDDVIDFAGQWGIYILHNNLSVMYVGQTTDRRLISETLWAFRCFWIADLMSTQKTLTEKLHATRSKMLSDSISRRKENQRGWR